VGVINIESLTKPLEGENPCGENLRWDRAYLALETLAEGKEGTETSPPVEPDWRQVRDACVELLARGRHLRIGTVLTLSAVRQEGYPGLRDGLAVLQAWLDNSWDTVWPVLDAEDNNDPVERINSLAAFGTPLATFGDKMKMLDRVYDAPICESRQLGNFSLRDLAIAAGTLVDAKPIEGQEQRPKPTMSVIDAAFAECDQARLEEFAAAAEQADASLDAIMAAFSTHCGDGIGPNFEPLKIILKDATTQVRRRLGQEVADDAGGSGSGSVEGGGGGRAALSGEVGSSHDAGAALGKVIRYYESQEPSSPVPLIARAAQTLVGKDFMYISKALPPDVVAILNSLANPPAESS